LGELEHLETSGGQIWGFLSWIEIGPRGEHTGKWVMISPGSVFVGDKWLFAGPIKPPFPVPIGLFRLNAFGRQVYLGRVVVVVREAAIALAADISAGQLRAIGEPATGRRDPELVMEGRIEVVYRSSPRILLGFRACQPRHTSRIGGPARGVQTSVLTWPEHPAHF
jgi:hypothetical protein